MVSDNNTMIYIMVMNTFTYGSEKYGNKVTSVQNTLILESIQVKTWLEACEQDKSTVKMFYKVT